jgi:hypothetical protein
MMVLKCVFYKQYGAQVLLGCRSVVKLSSRRKKGEEFEWVSIASAREPRFGPNVLPITYRCFPFPVLLSILYVNRFLGKVSVHIILEIFDSKCIYLDI